MRWYLRGLYTAAVFWKIRLVSKVRLHILSVQGLGGRFRDRERGNS